MKADAIGVKLTAIYKGINSGDDGFSPMIIHDEHRIQQVLLNF